jgi:hypothetical protein
VPWPIARKGPFLAGCVPGSGGLIIPRSVVRIHLGPRHQTQGNGRQRAIGRGIREVAPRRLECKERRGAGRWWHHSPKVPPKVALRFRSGLRWPRPPGDAWTRLLGCQEGRPVHAKGGI